MWLEEELHQESAKFDEDSCFLPSFLLSFLPPCLHLLASFFPSFFPPFWRCNKHRDIKCIWDHLLLLSSLVKQKRKSEGEIIINFHFFQSLLLGSRELSQLILTKALCGERPLASPGDVSGPGIKPGSPALQADSLPTELWGKPFYWHLVVKWSWRVRQHNFDDCW